MLGNLRNPPGASGRPLPFDELEREHSPAPRAIPPLCLRVLQSPKAVCEANCPGLQRDGGCLAVLVCGAADGWGLEIDRDGYWTLTS